MFKYSASTVYILRICSAYMQATGSKIYCMYCIRSYCSDLLQQQIALEYYGVPSNTDLTEDYYYYEDGEQDYNLE